MDRMRSKAPPRGYVIHASKSTVAAESALSAVCLRVSLSRGTADGAGHMYETGTSGRSVPTRSAVEDAQL
eukprot:scaffold6638_cov374-Prasinococcus_capsulatus_cf.AAC.2